MEKIPWNGSQIVNEGEGVEDKGCWKKRKPLCNRVDRGYYNERIIYSRRYLA